MLKVPGRSPLGQTRVTQVLWYYHSKIPVNLQCLCGVKIWSLNLRKILKKGKWNLLCRKTFTECKNTKLHSGFHIWSCPISTGLACLFTVEVRNSKKKWCWKGSDGGCDAISFHLLCVLYCIEGEFEQIISKLRVSINDNNNYLQSKSDWLLFTQ